MREYKRTERIGAQMQREIAAVIHDELKDPRLGMITVQEVRVTSDLSYAKVYFTTLGGKLSEKETEKLLNKQAAGFIKRELGHRMRLRTIPSLQFVFDTSIETGTHLSELIDQAVQADKHE